MFITWSLVVQGFFKIVKGLMVSCSQIGLIIQSRKITSDFLSTRFYSVLVYYEVKKHIAYLYSYYSILL